MKTKLATLLLLSTLITTFLSIGNVSAQTKSSSWQQAHPAVQLNVPKQLRGTYYMFNKTKSFSKGLYNVKKIQKYGFIDQSMMLNGQVIFSSFRDDDFYLIGKAKSTTFRLGHFYSYNQLLSSNKTDKIIRIHKVRYKGKWVKAISIKSVNNKKATLYFNKKIKKQRTTTNVAYKLRWQDTKAVK